MNLLDIIPYGYQNAVSREYLKAQCRMGDRTIRGCIEDLRKDHAILNMQNGDGYFQPLPEEKSLVQIWIGSQNRRMQSIDVGTEGAKKWLSNPS